MAATLLKLSDLAVGASATVREFPAQDPAFIRLREMGLLTGTRITGTDDGRRAEDLGHLVGTVLGKRVERAPF